MQGVFEGTNGRIEYADGRSTSCSYFIAQHDSGTVSIRCEHSHPDWVFSEGLSADSAPNRFTAITDEGTRLLLEGRFVQVPDLPDAPPPHDGVQVRYQVNGPLLLETNALPRQPLNVRFALLNLAFTGTVMSRYETDGGFEQTLDRTPLVLGGREFNLIRARNYSKVVEAISAARGVGITAFVTAAANDISEIEQLREAVKDLCALLTLATGCKVSVAADEVRNANGELVGGGRYSAVSRPYTQHQLIDTREPSHLPDFLQGVFEQYVALSEQFEMGRVIDARVDAIAGGFLETRTLMACVIADYLTGKYAALKGVKTLSFKQRLAGMAETLCPDVIQHVEEFVSIRNHLAHEMRFPQVKETGSHRLVLHVINRLIIGLLKYSGPYVDCRTWTVVGAGAAV